MSLAERDQRIAVPGSDGARVLVGHVDAAERQTYVIHDVGEIFRRDHTPHGVLDVLEQACGFLYARAGLGAHVHQDLAGVHRRKEVLAKERGENERNQYAGEKADQEQLRTSEREEQERTVALTDSLEAPLEPCLEALQRIAWTLGSGRRRSRVVWLAMAPLPAAHQIVGHGGHQRTRQDE